MTPDEIKNILRTIKQENNWATETTLKSIADKVGVMQQQSAETGKEIAGAIPQIGGKAEKVKIGIADSLKISTESLGKTFDMLSKLDVDRVSNNFYGLIWPLDKLAAKMKNTNPLLAKFAAGLSSTASVLTFLIGKFEDSTKMISDLYSSGIVAEEGILGLSTAAGDAGITTQKFAELMTKYSNVAIGTGYSRLIKLSKMFADTTDRGAKFMMSNEESQEALMETMSILQMSGRLNAMTDKEVRDSTEDYIGEINRLSEATGRNRKEIMATTKEALKLPNSFTLMNTMGPAAAKRFASMATQLSGMLGDRGKEMTEELAKFMQVGVAGLGPEMSKLMTGMGGDFGDAFKNLANVIENGGDEVGANFKMLEALQKVDTKRLAIVDPVLHAYVVNLQQATQQQYLDLKRRESYTESEKKAFDEQRARDKKAAEEQQKVINDGRAALAKMNNTIFQVIGALSPGLTTAFQALADVTIYVFNKLSDWGKWIRDFVQMKFFGGAGQDGEGKRKANMVTVAGLLIGTLIGGPLLLALMKKIVTFIVSGPSWILSKLAGAALKPLSKIPGLGPLANAAPAGAAAETASKGFGSFFKVFSVGNVMKLSVGLIAIAGALYIAGPAFKKFNDVDWESLPKAGVAIVGLAGSIRLAEKLMGPPAQFVVRSLALSVGIAAIGGALWAAGQGFKVMNEIEWESFGKAGLALGIIGGALVGVSLLAKPIAIGTAILAGSIIAIGAAIGGAAWIVGKTLPTLTQSLDNFAQLDGDGLINAGKGMVAIGGGLVALTAGQIIHGLGGLAAGFLSLFAADPVKELKRFADIGEPLKTAGEAIKQLTDSLPQLSGALTGITSLTSIFTSGFLDGFFGSKIDPDKIKSFINLFDTLGQAKNSITDGSQSLQIMSNIGEGTSLDGIKKLTNLFSSGFLEGFFGSNIDSDKIKRFINLFDTLGKSKTSIMEGALSLKALSESGTTLQIEGITKLTGLFTSGFLDGIFGTSISADKIKSFIELFDKLGKAKNIISEGSQALMIISDSGLNDEKIKGIQALSGMFMSSWWGGLFEQKIKEEKIKDFVTLFEKIGKEKNRINDGIDVFTELGKANLTEDRINGIKALSSMFGSNWFGDLFKTTISEEKIKAFSTLLVTLGTKQSEIKDGINSISGLFQANIDGGKIDSLKSLAEMFTSTWFSRMMGTKFDSELVNQFGGVMSALGSQRQNFANGAPAIEELLKINIDQNKLESIRLLGDVFSKGLLQVIGWSTKFDSSLVGSFGKMFEEFGKYTAAFSSGSASIGSLMSIDINKDRIEGIQKLIDLFSPAYTRKIQNVDPTKGLFLILNAFAANKDIRTSTDSLNALMSTNIDGKKMEGLQKLAEIFSSESLKKIETVDPNTGFFSILKAFSTNKSMIDVAVEAMSGLSNFFTEFGKIYNEIKKQQDMGKVIKDGVNSLMQINLDSNKLDQLKKLLDVFSQNITNNGTVTRSTGIFAILDAFANNKEIIDKAVAAINQLTTIDAAKLQLTFQKLQQIIPSVNGQTGPVSTPGTATPVITTEQLNQKTLKYYDDSIIQFRDLNDKIEKTNLLIEILTRENNDNSRRIISAVSSTGQVP